MTWRVLVADDEPAARRGVRQLLAAFSEFTIVGECRDGRETLAALDALQPDVLFLDIQMPEIDGFEVIRRRTPERMPATVFLTAYDEFAIRAFEAEALDYLLKPVSESRFAGTMQRLMRMLPRDETIIASTQRGTIVLNVRDIEWIEAAGNYARLWTREKSYLVRESLDQLERRVRGFARAHRSALVPLDRLRAIENEDGETVALLACGARVPVSRRRRAAFLAAVRNMQQRAPRR